MRFARAVIEMVALGATADIRCESFMATFLLSFGLVRQA
jgi:hypothetical protein